MKTPFLAPPFLMAFLSFLIALPSGSAASILGSAEDFALFGGTGITSTGVVGTVISNGNVGLSPAPATEITGFPPAVIVNGEIVATGPVTAQARQDLIKAQVGLAGMPSNANMSTVDLGGKTLPPGVYTFNSEATLNGALVLDGQGKNNVFWVFQIGTSLTTSINSTVTIINPGSNGGSDYGIFWNCGSAVTIGANNQIAGNYLAGTSLTFGDSSTRGGRALALAAISLDNNQIDARGGPGGGDWSGGLVFDANGNVVPFETLSFRHFGRANRRVTGKAFRMVRGSASVTAVAIQWRTNQRRHWQSVVVSANGIWKMKARPFHPGNNRLRLRAIDADGEVTAVQKLIVRRR